jgi:hypothetical protein
MLNYETIYKNHANTVLDWLPMDTEELYNTNLKTNYNLLKENNWIDSHFTYKFNTHGFRSEEFTNDSTVMFLGCSQTCGIGLPIDAIWAELVAKELNAKCANLGIGAGSCDTAFRLCHGWLDKINPTIVIMLEPPSPRLELIHDNKIENIILRNVSLNSYTAPWMTNNNNSKFNSLKNTLAIQYLCDQRSIKFIKFESFGDCVVPGDYARDLAHKGVKTNRAFANYVLSKI